MQEKETSDMVDKLSQMLSGIRKENELIRKRILELDSERSNFMARLKDNAIQEEKFMTIISILNTNETKNKQKEDINKNAKLDLTDLINGFIKSNSQNCQTDKSQPNNSVRFIADPTIFRFLI